MTKRQIELMKYNVHLTNHVSQQNPGKLWKVIKTFFFVILVSFLIALSFSWKVVRSQNSFVEGLTHLPVISQIKNLITGQSIKLDGAKDDRINFLILGQGGVGHEGPYLTDTIIIASIKPSTGQAAMLSIPRDFSVLIPGYGYRKINEANSIGEINEYEGGGSAYTAKILEDTLDIPIHYWVRIDFEGFKTVIDKLGGIEICVERGFTDEQYPTPDYLIQTLTFEKGCQEMDGDRALMFARSRHGKNGEGSDFARGARQQKIILAVKEKVLSWKTAISPNRIYNIIDTVKNNTQTNIEIWQIPNFINLSKKIDLDHTTQKSLDASQNGYLKNWITDTGTYVLIPRTGNYTEIRYLVKNIFQVNLIEQETANLIILNGTEVTGLAQTVADEFTMLGLRNLDIANSPEKGYEKTVIYKMNDSEDKKKALQLLKSKLDANVTDNLPHQLDAYFSPEDPSVKVPAKEEVDFLIILGQDIVNKLVDQGKLEMETEIKQ